MTSSWIYLTLGVIVVLIAFGYLLIESSYVAGREIIYYKDNGYIDPISGKFVVVGEIPNEGCRRIHNVNLGIVFYDSNSAIVFEHFAPVSIIPEKTTIVGDSKLPFIISVSDAVTQRVASYNFYRYEIGEDVKKETGLRIISSEIKLVETNSITKYMRWAITGEMENDSDQTARNVHVVSALYGEDGRVVGVAGYSLNDKHPMTLNPKESKSFSLEAIVPIKFNVTSFYVYADSENVAFKTEHPCWPPLGLYYDGDVVDKGGATIIDPAVGQELFFRVELYNQIDEPQSYAYFLQVKDEQGITLNLSWLTGTIEPGVATALFQSWIPEREGTYNPEIMIWSGLENPMPISIVYITSITVGE